VAAHQGRRTLIRAPGAPRQSRRSGSGQSLGRKITPQKKKNRQNLVAVGKRVGDGFLIGGVIGVVRINLGIFCLGGALPGGTGRRAHRASRRCPGRGADSAYGPNHREPGGRGGRHARR